MKMTRTVPALAGLLMLASLVGCKKETITNVIYADKVDTTGLVVKLLFNGNSIDSTPYHNDPQVPPNGCTPTTDRFGIQNNAYYFNGSSSYMQIQNSNSTDLKNSFTIAAWIRPDAYPTDSRGIIWHGNADVGKDPYVLYFKSNGSGSTNLAVRKDVLLGDTYNEIVEPGGLYFAKTWAHVVGTFDHINSIMRLYVNGELIIQNTVPFASNSINYPTASFWTVIGGYDTQGGLFKGKIDDVYIFNRAISSAEVKTLFQN